MAKLKKDEVPFRELLGGCIVIALADLVEKTESGIILTPEMQKQQQVKEFDKTMRIKVLMVGSECKWPNLKVGDEVFIQQRALQPGTAEPLIQNGIAKWLIIPDREIKGIY